MELLNVACGGDLIQHLENAEIHLHTPGEFTDHDVVLEPGSLAARAAGAERISVRSHHHQGVGSLGEGLEASGRSAEDEVIEAIELPDRTFALGVLWHAEEEPGGAVMRSFVAATRAGVAS
jgi:gamma-glutamyl-gamma-aminobutyrate hydrolase PuuD